jgi:hypothetical protein
MAKLIRVKQVSAEKSDHRRVRFQAVFEGEPTTAEISAAQQQAGYHPAGYGGPCDVSTARLGDDAQTVVTTWTCSDNCD